MLKFITLALVLSSTAFAEPLPRGANLDCSRTELNRQDCRYVAELGADQVEGNRTITSAAVIDMRSNRVARFRVSFRFSDGSHDNVTVEIEIDRD